MHQNNHYHMNEIFLKEFKYTKKIFEEILKSVYFIFLSFKIIEC